MYLATATIVGAVLAGIASACSQLPVGSNPSGNPINLPTLNQVVPAGKPFTISWNPTTPGKVSIVLLRGPSENVIPIDCLADSIANTGTFSWTPSTSLTPDVTHYGLQIVVTGTGQFQYSTQFGISNAGFVSSQSASLKPTTSKPASISATEKTSLHPITQITDGQIQVPTSIASLTPIVSSVTPIVSSVTPLPSANSTFVTYKPSGTGTAPIISHGTGVSYNATRLLPSKPLTIPYSFKPNAPTNIVPAVSPTSGTTAGTPTPLTANPNAAGKGFAASGLLGMLGMAVALLI
ncbi:hypothetical protein MMC07_002706 [Pseudocyphellaria aurata]|nr:hypothetical protein [Pseudocyphellaria aurata]